MGQLNSVAQSCLQNVLSRGREGGELFGKSLQRVSKKSAGVVYLMQKTDPKMGPLDGPNFGAAFTYLIGSGPNCGSARRTQNWVRRSCCFGDDVCKCEVAAARGVNCVDAPRVVCWCTEKVFWGIELYTN